MVRPLAVHRGEVIRRVGDEASARASTPRSRPSTRCDWVVSVMMSWQSVWRMSVASSSPRRVGLMPTITAPERAAPVSRKKYSGMFSSSTPTWKGPGRRRSSSSAARALASATTCRQRPLPALEAEPDVVVLDPSHDEVAGDEGSISGHAEAGWCDTART